MDRPATERPGLQEAEDGAGEAVAPHETPLVYIAMPCQDIVKAQTSACLAALIAYTDRVAPGTVMSLVQDRGTILQSQRTALARDALEKGATHILWLDADMTFPPDTLLRLLAHGKPMAAVNYCSRRWPYEPTAKDLDLKAIYTDHFSTGLVPAVGCGMGCFLMETGLLAALPEPWFDITPGFDDTDGKRRQCVGEDYYFCYLVGAELDLHPVIDQDLSKLVGHIGEKVCTFEDALGCRAMVRLIRSDTIERPGDVLPHETYRHLTGLSERYDAEELARKREEYEATLRAREDAEEAEILASRG